MNNSNSFSRGSRYAIVLTCVLASMAMNVGAAASQLTSADVIYEWNITTLEITAAAPFNPPLESRNVAIVHGAIFDAVNSILREYHPYAIELRARAAASPEAAAAAAAYTALAHLYPAQQATIDAAYATSLAKIPDGPVRSEGIAVGERVALQLLALRADDGSTEALGAPYISGTALGSWVPTPPASLNALAPGWGKVKPFVLTSASQFRPGPPPLIDSRRYARDFNEIKEIGSAASTTRTQEETELARLWIATGPQNWNRMARQIAIARNLGLSGSARLFALLNLAGADAFIASWDTKFFYNQWRPVTAIRVADNNSRTQEDPSWTPLLITPPFPDYIAGHTVYAGAAAKVLEAILGNCPGVDIELRSASLPGIVHTYKCFDDVADDVVEARILGGIHWRTSSELGQKVGERIGRFAVQHLIAPRHRGDEE